MKHLLSYPLSIVFYFFFVISLLVFHPIQWIALNGFGYKAHKKSVEILQILLIGYLGFLGSRVKMINLKKLPTDRPLIIVANHQSMFDIPPIIYFFRKHHPKFVGKASLGKGIPSVSYNLKHGGSVLINRSHAKSALEMIKKFGEYIQKNNYAAVIFPEGTRSTNGDPKPFKINGLKSLFENIPNALVVPVTINNSWKITGKGHFPLGIGAQISFLIHPAVEIGNNDHETLISQIESTISSEVILG